MEQPLHYQRDRRARSSPHGKSTPNLQALCLYPEKVFDVKVIENDRGADYA
ncbi:hypothetical protein [Desulfobulbus propionicus]